MSCPSCGRANRAGARFCAGCGASLAPRCPACGVEARPDGRFCDACGAALAPASAPAEASVARKVVTIVFADLIGSTALHEKLDPESVSRVMEAYHAAVRVPVEAHGGTVVQLLGDGVMCAFGVPQVAEDDALRAVRAAVAVQQAFRAFVAEHPELAGKVGLRVAVNTGEVVVSDDYAAGIGDPLNVAARLQQEARDGDVLIGESTQRHVRERVTLAQVGSFALKGRAEPVAAYRVVSLERPAGAAALPFVGREDELRRLQAVYDAAVSAPGARLAVLLGSPGLGKSRLVAELAQRLEGRVALLAARCESARGATFAPLAGALRAHLGERGEPSAQVEALLPADEPERARIVSGVAALLAGEPASPQETFFVVRRFLAALAKARPVLLLIDDLHWAEPLLLDLVEHLVQWGSGVRLLVLAAARPELRALRSSLATPGPLASDVVTLAGLDAIAATQLAARVIGAEAFPAAIAGRVLAASEGNPLFLAELVRMLVDDGVLRREGESWVAADAIADFAMPPSIQALLAARIERLAPEERTVLERAAVVGRHFSRSALAALLPRELSDLDARLEALRRSELIEPDTGWLLGEPALRFHHALIRDAAYRRVLKNTRAELHARIGGWMEERAGAAVEYDETIGWHFEQAHQNLRELGPLDERGRAFGARAARYLGAAGQRALARDDLPLAAGLLGRALERLEPESPARTELLLDRCEALLATGEVGAAPPAVAELGRLAAGSERLRAWHTCFAGQLAALTDPEALRATAESAAAAAETLAAAGDAVGEAKAHAVHAGALARLGAIGGAEAALDRALAAARRAGDRRRANAVLAGAPLAALFGPSPVTRASGRCLDVVRVLRITQGAPGVEAVALRCQAVLEALRGRLDAARRMIAASRRLVEELGITQQLLESDVFAGQIEWLAGDAVAAERWLRDAYTGMRQRGLRIDAARAAAQLGRVLLAEGRAGEAEALSHESEALAGDDLQAAIAWRGVRAEALAQRGEHAGAVELARSAVEIASATDALLHHADARRALAAVLGAAGRSTEAAQEDARALELWEAKGATLLAERARQAAGRSAAAERAPAPRAPGPAARRVRANRATAHVARFDAAIAARDAHTIRELVADPTLTTHHPTGVEYGRDDVLRGLLTWIELPAASYRHEPLATLGDSLVLCRTSAAAGSASLGDLDVGAIDRENVALIETDLHGRRRRAELFAPDHLGDAIARLYARHAELMPEGSDRERVAATARSVAALLGAPELELWASVFAPEIEFVDARNVGFGTIRGTESVLSAIRSLFELMAEYSNRIEEVLGARDDALLVRWTNSGSAREGGGSFERNLCHVWCFRADGRLLRWEQFDGENAEAALARFDALTAAAPPPARRRVRPNAATAQGARMDAAVGARDLDALRAELAELVEVVEHPTGTVFDASGMLAAWRQFLRAEAPVMRGEPLATLGDSLALYRSLISLAALAPRLESELGSFGPVERESLVLFETGPHGLQRRVELFAPDRVDDAIARLYALHAAQLPDGPERRRAEGTARTLAAFASGDPERLAECVAPDCTYVDHRPLGFPALRGAEAVWGFVRSIHEVADGVVFRMEDVLGNRPHVLLDRGLNTGSERSGGGAFERRFLALRVFDADGRVVRWEHFDLAQADEALVRFDALTGEAPRPARRRVHPNAATKNMARIEAAVAAREVDELATLGEPSFESLHHPTETTFDLEATARTLRWMVQSGASFRLEPLATLGDALALFHQRVSSPASGNPRFEVGAFEIDLFVIHEAEEGGRAHRTESFATDHLGDAVARLYERHAELLPEGPERERAAATARAAAAWLGPFDPERYASAYAADIEAVDHRVLGTWAARGAAAVLRNFYSLQEVARSIVLSDELLALGPQATLVHRTHRGTELASGGAYEREFLMLHVYGQEGLVTRIEWFDVGAEALAFARFDAVAAEPPAVRFENAVTRTEEVFGRLWHAGDWAAWAALTPPGFKSIDRRPLMHLEVDGETMLRGVRPFFEMGAERASQLLATRGERLALFRMRLRTSDAAEGTSEVEFLQVVEVDERGRRSAAVAFGSDAVDAAHAELDARYVAGEGAAYAALLSSFQELGRALAGGDRGALARILPRDFELTSHRRFANVGRTLSRDEYVASLGLIDVLGVQADLRLHHLHVAGTALIGDTTWHGTRDGGEFELSLVFVAKHDGERLRSWELFDREQTDAALARYAELSAAPGPRRFTNRAFRSLEHLGLCWRERNWEAVVAAYAPGFVLDDRRSLTGVAVSGEDFLANVRFMYAIPSSRFEFELLATRGERLVLCRTHFAGEAEGGGAFEWPMLTVVEVDDSGCLTQHVIFDRDAVDAAFAELDARYAAGEGVGDVAWQDVAAWTGAFNTRDFEGLARRLAPDFALHDHRALGWGAVDGARYVELLRSLTELAPDTRYRLDHFVSGGRGCLTVGSVLGTRDGGAFEMTRITVVELDAAGRRRRMDQYDDAGQLDLARARFAELQQPAGAARLENAAKRAAERHNRSWNERDWEGVVAVYGPGFEMDDRRTLVGLPLSGEDFLASARLMFALRSSHFGAELCATRGDRLVLLRTLFTGEAGAGGGIDVPLLCLVEVAGDGRYARNVVFDPDALEAALAELDARYFAGEAAAHPRAAATMQAFIAAFASRDWNALGALFAEGVEARDQRRLGWEPLHSRAAYVDSLRALVELAPDAALRIDHARLSARGALWVASWIGTREGGAFETPWIIVSEHDAAGVVQRFDQYDVDRLDDALARFAELSAPLAQAPRFENAATRAEERLNQAGAARDIDRFAAFLAPGFRYHDRRRIVASDADRSSYVESLRPLLASSSRVDVANETLATRGDRLSLARIRITVSGVESGPSEIEFIQLFETDVVGLITLGVAFDPDDLDAAWAELDARYSKGEGATCTAEWREVQAWARAFNARDFDAVAEPLATGFELHDHRTLGWGLVSGSGFVELLRSLVELAPDVRYRVFHFHGGKQRSLSIGGMSGTRDGGAFEITRVVIRELDASGRLVRTDHYDLDQLDEARARFEALRPDPLRIPPNAATRLSERLHATFVTHDAESFEALIAPGFHFDDRRRGVRMSGDRETFLASARLIRSGGTRPARTVLATAGERLALERKLWRNEKLGMEVDTLDVFEIDAEGRLVASIAFDPDDRRAASRELFERWARSDAVSHLPVAALEGRRAILDHDLARLRATLPEDYEFHDHRRTGPGLIGGAEGYVGWIASLFERSADAAIETLYFIASEPHGSLSVARTFGTLADGGPFESSFVQLTRLRGGRMLGVELFELEDLDRARTRFEELRPDPLRIPPNAATRASARLHECFVTGDMEAFAAAVAPSFEFDDRRRGIRNSGDRETFLASARLIRSAGTRPIREVLATAGERLVLEHALWRNERLGTEVETFDVIEVDAEGRLVASVVFDPDDRRGASEEMLVRFQRGEGARPGSERFIEFVRAARAHDAVRARAALPDDFALHDHRRTGLGRLGNADDYVASLAGLWEQSSDAVIDTLYYVDRAEHATLSIGRISGTLASGGEFESPFVRLGLFRDGQFTGAEVYELEDLERAKARFEELRPDPLAIPPNAARRAGERIASLRARGDWAALRALLAPDFRFEDRRKRALVSGDVELYVRNLEVVASYPDLKATLAPLATAGERVSLARLSYTGDPSGSAFEGEFLLLIELDAGGRIVAVLHFDADDRSAAFEELQRRFVAGEAGSSAGQAAIAALGRAFTRHAWDEVRACFARDGVMQDHRTLGFGELGVEGWLDSLRVLSELAPDVQMEPLRILAWNARGRVSLVRVSGTHEGGAFENLFVSLAFTPGDRIQRFEFFDVADAPRALARFAELTSPDTGS